jgi:hypothetical protein
MKKQQQWLAASLAALAIGSATPAVAGEDSDKCATKVSEIDAAIEEARKEGSMRKVATLKDLRVEALRCANKGKTAE